MPERGSKMSTVPVVWANFWNFFRRNPNDFLSLLVTMDEIWLYHYDPETKQQSMEWQHSVSSRPKYSEWKNPLENFLPRFFEMKKAFLSFILFQRAELSTRSVNHLCWCNWRKKAPRSSPRVSCFLTTMPPLTGHLQSWRNWPNWASIILITQPILRIWPRRTTTCSLDWKKKQLKGRHFSSDAEVIAAAETWLDGQISEFFWVACKS